MDCAEGFRSITTPRFQIGFIKAIDLSEIMAFVQGLQTEGIESSRGLSKKVKIDRSDYIVKQYFHGGAISFLKGRYFFSNPLANEVKMLDYLRKRGLNVPEIGAYIILRYRLYSRYFLLLRVVDNSVQIGDLLPDNPRLIKEIINTVKTLHDSYVYHGDLNISNMLFDGIKFYLLDLGQSRFSDQKKHFRADIFRFVRSLDKNLGNKINLVTKLRIFRYYFGAGYNLRKIMLSYKLHSFPHKLLWSIIGRQ
ncbi:MAG: hypothetical protein HY606_10060 [Planctomycetes bacterium]|nr:hypothetical protein [Planctomycetota bacterium]